MCSTNRIAITFSINLDKYGRLETGRKFFKLSLSSVGFLRVAWQQLIKMQQEMMQ